MVRLIDWVLFYLLLLFAAAILAFLDFFLSFLALFFAAVFASISSCSSRIIRLKLSFASSGARRRSLFWHSFALSADRPGGGRTPRQSGRTCRSSARSSAERPTQMLFERLVGRRSYSSTSAESRYYFRLNFVGKSESPETNSWLMSIEPGGGLR